MTHTQNMDLEELRVSENAHKITPNPKKIITKGQINQT